MKEMFKKVVKGIKFNDVAIQFRMVAGFSGDVTRSHPVDIEGNLINANAPPAIYGQLTLMDPTTQGVRPWTTGDASGAAYGVTVRPFPYQAPTASQANGGAPLGNAAAPASGVIDICRRGYILVQVNAGQTAPVKGGAVYVRVAATAATRIIGQLETAADGGNSVLVTNAVFAGGTDANNVAELMFNI